MKLRTAFFFSLLAVLLVMSVPAVLAVEHVREVRTIAVGLKERTAEAALLVGRIHADLERLDRVQRAHVATGDPELAARTALALSDLTRHLERLHEVGYRSAVGAAEGPVAELRTYSALTTLLMEEGHGTAATAMLRSSLTPALVEAGRSVDLLAAAVDDQTADQLQRVDTITARAITVTTVSLLLALVVAIATAAVAARLLSRPLNRLAISMARVADGEFQPPEHLPYDRRDEVGDLLRAFRTMALRLADLDRMKAQIVSIASHDLKTPVNVIGGYAELLAEELAPQVDTRQREMLVSLNRQSRTLSARIDQLLKLSQIEASGLRLGLEQLRLRHFVAELERVYAAKGERESIRFSTEVQESAPSFLVADPDCLRREVFGNLLQNAFRFTPRGGSIRLRVSGFGGTVLFELADDGPRIPPADLPRAFDRYYQGHKFSGRVGGGLELPIAQAGAEAHGGTLEAVSREDDDTTFRISLPIHPTVPAARGGSAGSTTPPATVGAHPVVEP